MTLTDLAALGSFVSGVAVVVSLVLLYFQLAQINQQIRQAESNQRATLTQGYLNRLTEINRWSIDSGMAELIARAVSGETNFTRDELNKLAIVFRVIILSAQDGFLARQAGLLDQTVLDVAMRVVRGSLALPVMRALWLIDLQQFFVPEFRDEVERLIAETPLAQPVDDTMDRFQAALAKIKG